MRTPLREEMPFGCRSFLFLKEEYIVKQRNIGHRFVDGEAMCSVTCEELPVLYSGSECLPTRATTPDLSENQSFGEVCVLVTERLEVYIYSASLSPKGSLVLARPLSNSVQAGGI